MLDSTDKSLKKYVSREWVLKLHVKALNLTREHLREVVAAIIATGDGDHATPFVRQGTGTINMLILAMLSQTGRIGNHIPSPALAPYEAIGASLAMEGRP